MDEKEKQRRNTVEKYRQYQETHTSFINHRLIADSGRVDARGAGSFFRDVKAARTEYLAFSHSLWSCSAAIVSGGAPSGRAWPSAAVIKNESSLSKVLNPELVFCSKESALSYAALNFRVPNGHLYQ